MKHRETEAGRVVARAAGGEERHLVREVVVVCHHERDAARRRRVVKVYDEVGCRMVGGLGSEECVELLGA
jgi:hypothetical protein